ncbi:MAG: class GN sortase [Nitrospirota bacterium]|nr:MAG: class GN sortase [Nitrospirota bacterium]
MIRPFLHTLAAMLVSLGLWQTGQGLWIYLKADLAQYLLEFAWSQTLKGEREVKPWPWADTWPIGRLLVPRQGIDLIVLANANRRTLAFGPGHESISTPPGENGTTILSGHRDTHFRFLEFLREGDRIVIQHPNSTITLYTIQAIDIVDAHQTTIHLNHLQNHLVLVTCYPFDAITPGGSLRYVVTAMANKPAFDHDHVPVPPHRFSQL